MSISKINSFITQAQSIGVSAEALQPFTNIIGRYTEVETTLDNMERSNPVAEAYSTGGDILEAIKAEVETDAIYNQGQKTLMELEVLSRNESIKVANNGAVDTILIELEQIYATAHAGANKVYDRWGNNPNPARVANEATAAELKDYRALPGHAATVKQTVNLIDKFFVANSAGTPIATVLHPLQVSDVAGHKWFIRSDGTMRTVAQARAALNAHYTRHDLSWHGSVLTFPKPLFTSRYALTLEALAAPDLDKHGEPVNEGDLLQGNHADGLENSQYYEIFGTASNDSFDVSGDPEQASQYRAKLDESLS